MAGPNFGKPWVALTLALFVHVLDETWNNFLVVYNPTAISMRERFGVPLPVFQFEVWLGGLLAACLLLAVVAPLAFRNVGWLRPVAYALALLMIANAIGHAAGTIAGRTFSGLEFARPMPGFWSSPLLAAGGVWLLRALRQSRVLGVADVRV